MKTLGQIAFDGFFQYIGGAKWDETFPDATKNDWEAAAQAVRAAVIEECAKEIYWTWASTHEPGDCADAIRALKDKK